MGESQRVLRILVLAVVVAAVAAVGGASTGVAAPGHGKGFDQALADKLKDSARGSVKISTNKGTDQAGFIEAGQNGDLLPNVGGKAAKAKADAFLDEYGALVGASGDGSALVAKSVAKDDLGATRVEYTQEYQGVPVFGATVLAHVDAAGNLSSVNGVAVPEINIDATPQLDATQAAEDAISAVLRSPPENELTGEPAKLTRGELYTGATTLYVYRTGLLRGTEGSSQLVYRVEVTNGGSVRDIVFVGANTGKIFNRYSVATDALFRRVFEQHFTPADQVWQEGDPFPGALNVDQQNIVTFSGDAYRFFMNVFGRDAYDGNGAVMNTVNNDPRINCPNANWNGVTTNYCNGVTADDVVAHEWGHAYTEFTDGLVYQWQQGALNESYSDIWGETVDQLNGLGTDAPSGNRTSGVCSSRTVPTPILIINAPTPGECAAGAAAFGPPLTGAGTTGDLVLVDDGVEDPSRSNGCTTPYANAAALAGKIALIDRGVCTFAVKVKNAQTQGAIAVVIANNTTGVINMAGNDPSITIPSLSVSQANGNLLKGYIAQGTTNVTLKVKGGAGTPENSVRWLLSEDATAFNAAAGAGNHAIRDMWNPNCLSAPGKVTDAEYSCGTSDAGGVHTNSGVPNHGYSLLVDGGTFNGHTVVGIGLTKAAHIYWRAQSVYQTSLSNFADHADALEASCRDLIGAPLTNLSTGAPAGMSADVISAADCAQVTEMVAAVELRTDPTSQCNFTTLLDQDTPDLCQGQKNPPVLYEERFETGLAGWTVTNEGKYAGWPGTNWTTTSSLPGDHAGSAAFAADLDGDCDQNGGDVSGVMRLISPQIVLPNAGILSPRLTFDHYVYTEIGADGGNLKISVNGGAFALVPKSAFTFNGYNLTMTSAAGGNTSPLAGEDGFSGSDGGQPHGTWGTSQVDLTKIGVKPGDTIQLRFDFGMDGCGAFDGWYVDDVQVKACNTKKGTKTKPDKETAKKD